MARKWPTWAQNGHFQSFDKVPFVGTLKFCQKIPDIMKSESINLITKLQPKWPKNGLKWPNRAQNGHFPSFNKVPFVGTLKLYQEMPDIIQSDLIKFDHQYLAKMAEKWAENGLFGPNIIIIIKSTIPAVPSYYNDTFCPMGQKNAKSTHPFSEYLLLKDLGSFFTMKSRISTLIS